MKLQIAFQLILGAALASVLVGCSSSSGGTGGMDVVGNDVRSGGDTRTTGDTVSGDAGARDVIGIDTQGGNDVVGQDTQGGNDVVAQDTQSGTDPTLTITSP